MVAQFIVGIGVHEHVERSVIERKPTHDVEKLRWRKRDLVAPPWMGSDLSLVKAAHLNPIAELRGHYFAKFPGRIATGRIEVDMRMPARDARHIEIRHCRPIGSHANPFGQSTFNSSSAPSVISRQRLAGVYKLAGAKARKASNDAGLRRRLLYDLRRGWGVALQVERAEQAVLQRAHAGEA